MTDDQFIELSSYCLELDFGAIVADDETVIIYSNSHSFECAEQAINFLKRASLLIEQWEEGCD